MTREVTNLLGHNRPEPEPDRNRNQGQETQMRAVLLQRQSGRATGDSGKDSGDAEAKGFGEGARNSPGPQEEAGLMGAGERLGRKVAQARASWAQRCAQAECDFRKLGRLGAGWEGGPVTGLTQ